MTHEQLKTYESQLKPCPFCGGKARLRYFAEDDIAFIICSNHDECKLTPFIECGGNFEEAIKAWNTRSAESKVLEDIKAEIKERIEMWGTDNDEYHDCLEIIDKHINKKGTWFDRGSLSCRCSACGCKNDKEEPICPNCKTEMEIGQ